MCKFFLHFFVFILSSCSSDECRVVSNNTYQIKESNTSFATREELEEAVKTWAIDRNFKQKGVNWQFTNKDARIKLKRLYPIIVN